MDPHRSIWSVARRRLGALGLAASLAGAAWGGLPSIALAQDLGREAVQQAIELTDVRIDQAADLLASRPDEAAAAQLALARDLQARAKASFSAGQYAIAHRQTRDARLRADRVIATIRGLPDPERVSQQLERTREVLDRARDRLARCEETRARALLRVALEMQTRADAAFADGRYLAALQLTMSARERAEKALTLCRADESLEESAQRVLQATDDLLLRVRESVAESGLETPAALLARAEALQAEAKREAGSGRYAAATRLSQGARLQAQRALRLAQRSGARSR